MKKTNMNTKAKTGKTKILKAVPTKIHITHSPVYITKILHGKAKKVAKANGMTLTEWANKNFYKALRN